MRRYKNKLLKVVDKFSISILLSRVLFPGLLYFVFMGIIPITIVHFLNQLDVIVGIFDKDLSDKELFF